MSVLALAGLVSAGCHPAWVIVSCAWAERELFKGYPGKMECCNLEEYVSYNLKTKHNITTTRLGHKSRCEKFEMFLSSFILSSSPELVLSGVRQIIFQQSMKPGDGAVPRAMCENHSESFLFYVNRDWWNILHRVWAFDKRYWWLLSVSVTWDDRTLHFKMNYTRNSLFGNVIHFISSVVLWENDWSHEYFPLNCSLCTLEVPGWCTPILNIVMGKIFILANNFDKKA